MTIVLEIRGTLQIDSFELHAKPAEEIDLEMCSYGQLSEVQMLRDLDLGSDQGHIKVQLSLIHISEPTRPY